jgi:hypothetical protein
MPVGPCAAGKEAPMMHGDERLTREGVVVHVADSPVDG